MKDLKKCFLKDFWMFLYFLGYWYTGAIKLLQKNENAFLNNPLHTLCSTPFEIHNHFMLYQIIIDIFMSNIKNMKFREFLL